MDYENYAGVEEADAADQQSEEVAEHAEHQQVPLEALEKIREELQKIKYENESLRGNLKMYSDHFELLRNGQFQQQAQQQAPQEPEIFSNDDGEYLTVGQAKKFAEYMAKQQDKLYQTNQQMFAKQQASVAEINFMAANPDYRDVIQTYLPEALKEDPELADDIRGARNPYSYAYKMAKKCSKYVQEQAKKSLSPESKKAFDNMTKPKSLSSVGNASKVSTQGKYNAMSDSEFRKLMAKNLGVI